MVAAPGNGHGPVLVIDDDEGIRDAIAEVLADSAHPVATASNGREALDWLQTHQRPCLILLDLMMPVMDGRQFRAAQRADARLADIPVVVITAGGDQTPKSEMAVQGWLGKPVELEVLLAHIGQFCSRPHPVVSPSPVAPRPR